MATTGDGCPDHEGTPAVAGCVACHRGLCDECYRFLLDGGPACSRCAFEATTRSARRKALGAAFFGIAAGIIFWATRRFDLASEFPVFLAGMAIATPVVAALLAFGGGSDAPRVDPRPETDEPPEPIGEGDLAKRGSPFRAHVRRAVAAISPEISGRATILVLGACLVASAVLLPASVKLPRWVEAEIVLGLWWVTLTATIAMLLYNDFRLKDDYVYFVPWNRPGAAIGASSWLDGCNSSSFTSFDGEGCIGVLLGAVVTIVFVMLAWVFVELAMPVVFLTMYAVLMRAIRRAARDHHDCAKDLGRSIGWGALWSTIYLVPLAAITALVHFHHHAAR